MALNLVGLGFTFGAEDKGAIQFQKTLIDGFKQISESMMAMSQNASGGFTRTMDGVDSNAASMSDSFNRSVEEMGERIGVDFPEASESGADRFAASSETIAKAQDKIASGFASMKDMSFKLNQILSTNRLSAFIQAVNMKRLGEIKDGLGNIGTAGRNLTTGFEAQAQELAVSARKTGANLGLTGAALGKFTKQAAGMAFALQIDAGEAGQAIRNFEWAAERLGAVGIKSASDLAKVSMVTGVSAGELAVSVRRMNQEFGFSDEAVKKLYGSFTAMGQEMFDVGGSVKQIPQVLDLLRAAAHASGRELDQMELQQFATGTAAAARAFFEFTQDGNKAYEMAMQLGQTIVSTRKDFRNLFAGVGSEMPQMLKSIGIAAGDINTAFDLMNQGPDGFMKGLAQMVGAVKKRGGYTAQFANQLAARLEEAVGEEQAQMLLTFFTKADEATLEAMGTIQNAEVSLGELGKAGWSSSRTLAESYEMAKDSMIAQFRSISKARVEFVRNSAKEFAAFGKAAKKLAAEGGPLGLVIERLSAIHSIGAVGVLPKSLQTIGALFGEIATEALPMLTMLGAMGFRLSTLVHPLSLAAVGVAALGVNFAAAYKEAGPLMKNAEKLKELGFREDQIASVTRMDVAFKLFEKKLIGFVDYVREWGPKIYNSLVKGLLDISNRLLKFADDLDFDELFGKLFERLSIKGDISKSIQNFADDVMLLFSDALSGRSPKAKTMLGQVLINLTAAFVKIFRKVGAQLAKIDFGGIFRDTVKGLWMGLTGQMDPASSEGASSAQRIAGAIGKVIGGALVLLKDFVATTLLPAIGDVVSGILKGFAGEFDPKTAAAASTAERMGLNIGGVAKEAFGQVKDYLKEYFKKWWAEIGDIWKDPSKSFKEKVTETIGESGPIIAGGFLAAKVGAGPAGDAFGKLISIGMGVVVIFTSIAGLGLKIATSWGTIGPILSEVGSAFAGVSAGAAILEGIIVGVLAAVIALTIGFLAIPEYTQKVVDQVSQWLSDFGENIGYYATKWAMQLGKFVLFLPYYIIKYLPEVLTALWKAGQSVSEWWSKLITGIGHGVIKALREMFPSLERLWGIIDKIINLYGLLMNPMKFAKDIATKGLKKTFDDAIKEGAKSTTKVSENAEKDMGLTVDIFSKGADDIKKKGLDPIGADASSVFGDMSENARAMQQSLMGIGKQGPEVSAALGGMNEGLDKIGEFQPPVGAFGRMATDFQTNADTMSMTASDMKADVFDQISGHAQTMSDDISATVSDVEVMAEDSFMQLAESFSVHSEDISQTFTDMMDGIFVTFADTFKSDVIDVVVGGFVDAFEQVTKEATEFIQKMDDKFTAFAKDFSNTIRTAMLVSLAFVADSVSGIETDLDRMIGQMQKLTEAIQQAVQAQANAQRLASKDVMEETAEQRERLQELSGEMKVLARFIDRPAWVGDKTLTDVIAHLASIQGAVERLNTVTVTKGGGKPASRSAMEQLLKYGVPRTVGG